jgi:hypothetical protein
VILSRLLKPHARQQTANGGANRSDCRWAAKSPIEKNFDRQINYPDD